MEFDGTALPNSRGASFYKTRNGKLCYARDIVESPLKLGAAALGIVGFIAQLVRCRAFNSLSRTLNIPLKPAGKSLVKAG